MAENPRSDGAKELLSEYMVEDKSDKKEDKKEEKKEKKSDKPKSEEMGEISMRVILPDSPELSTLEVGSQIMLNASIVAKSGGKVSVDVLGIEPSNMDNKANQMPSLADVNSALAQSSGGGVPADAGIAPIA